MYLAAVAVAALCAGSLWVGPPSNTVTVASASVQSKGNQAQGNKAQGNKAQGGKQDRQQPGAVKPKPFEWLDVPNGVTGKRPRWVADSRAAFEEAGRRNCPVLLMFAPKVNDPLAFCMEYTVNTKSFAELSRKCVALAGLQGVNHDFERRKVNGREVRWCKLLDIPCEQHRFCFHRHYSHYVHGEFVPPVYIFVAANGEELDRRYGPEVTPRDLAETLAECQKKLGETLPLREYHSRMKKLRDLVDRRAGRSAALVLDDARSYTDREPSGSGMRAITERVYLELLAEGRRRVAEASRLADAGKAEQARKELEQIARSYRSHPPGIEANLILKRIKKDG